MIKKQNLIFFGSILAIVIMAGYLLIGDMFKTSDYSALIKTKSDAEEIVIKNPGSEIKLFKKDGKWFVGKNSFPADADLIKKLEKELRALKISDQISKGEFASKYDLGTDKAVDIIITFADKKKKLISAGKKSSTNNHVYVRVDAGPEIYLAAGNVDSAVSKTEDSFRNREIFKIPSGSVSSFEINYKGKTFSFIKKTEEKTEKVNSSEGKPGIENKIIKTDTWTCTGYENIKLNADAVTLLISDFNPLMAASFISDEKKLVNPIATVKIKSAGKDLNLVVFEKDKDKYPAKSSESVYLFNLDDAVVKKFFIENIEGLKAPLK